MVVVSELHGLVVVVAPVVLRSRSFQLQDEGRQWEEVATSSPGNNN
jgi:hypothetical protein